MAFNTEMSRFTVVALRPAEGGFTFAIAASIASTTCPKADFLMGLLLGLVPLDRVQGLPVEGGVVTLDAVTGYAVTALLNL